MLFKELIRRKTYFENNLAPLNYSLRIKAVRALIDKVSSVIRTLRTPVPLDLDSLGTFAQNFIKLMIKWLISFWIKINFFTHFRTFYCKL